MNSKINDITKFPVRTSAEENGKSPKFVGYDDDGNIAMRANELVTRGITDDLANIQTLLGVPEKVRRSVVHVVSDVDLTTDGFTTAPIPAGKLFICTNVVGYAKTIDTWTVIPPFCAAGYTLAADIAANASDFDDRFFDTLGQVTSSLIPDEAVNPIISVGRDLF